MHAPWDFALFSAAALVATVAAIAAGRLRRSARVAIGVLIAVLAGGWYYVRSEGQREAHDIERLVAAMAPTYAGELERLGHSALPLDVRPDDPAYLRLVEAEKRWLAANPEVADIYTCRRRPDGTVVYLVDSETDYDRDGVFEGGREARTPAGEPIRQPNAALLAAFEGRTTFTASTVPDRWGNWVSSFVPLRDPEGRIEGVLGVDFEASLFDGAVERGRVVAMAAVGLLLAVALTALVAVARQRRLTEELEGRNRELARARDAALAANQAKSRFLANVSHELRTPLHVFLGMNELLLDSNLDERQRKQAETARRAAEGLLGMVDDLLDFAQLEAGKLSSDQFVFDLGELVAAGAESHRGAAEAKGLAFAIDVAPSAHARVLSDPRRVRQILRHLVGNAIKFTERGGVTVRARIDAPAGASEERRRAVVEVVDTGVGIDASRRAELFDSFSQLDPSTTRRHGGTGIGLALSRALSERLGGGLELVPGEAPGSTFRLSFPLRDESAP